MKIDQITADLLVDDATKDIQHILDNQSRQESSIDVVEVMAAAWGCGYMNATGKNVIIVVFIRGEIIMVQEMCKKDAQSFVTGYNLAVLHCHCQGDAQAYLWPNETGKFPIEYWSNNTSREEIEDELRSMIKS